MSGVGRFSTEAPASTERVLADIGDERERQFTKWGPQHHDDGTGHCVPMPLPVFMGDSLGTLANRARQFCDDDAAAGQTTWLGILFEEVFEAASEEDVALLRKELVQVAAVATAWVEDIDSRAAYAEVADLGGEG